MLQNSIEHLPQEKNELYVYLNTQFQSLVVDETDFIANTANLCALISTYFKHHWVGIYLVKDQELVLGPFQGPVACTRISYGKGVCGTAWKEQKTLIVPNVQEFPGHIACSALSNSEIVVPFRKNGVVIGVLDIDSEQFNCFDQDDQKHLENLLNTLITYSE